MVNFQTVFECTHNHEPETSFDIPKLISTKLTNTLPLQLQVLILINLTTNLLTDTHTHSLKIHNAVVHSYEHKDNSDETRKKKKTIISSSNNINTNKMEETSDYTLSFSQKSAGKSIGYKLVNCILKLDIVINSVINLM